MKTLPKEYKILCKKRRKTGYMKFVNKIVKTISILIMTPPVFLFTTLLFVAHGLFEYEDAKKTWFDIYAAPKEILKEIWKR